MQREYQRTYNRLKQQHQRRKKGDTEYNRQVAQAQDIRDAYARRTRRGGRYRDQVIETPMRPERPASWV